MTNSISAIIPVYNGSAHLAGCLNSVLAQTTKLDEIIVVDDGSTDGSATLAAATAPSAKIIRQARQGPARARNNAAAAARGNYLAFLDHDDLWPPDRTTNLLAASAATPDAGLICGRVHIEPATGKGDPHIPYLFQSSLVSQDVWVRLGGMSAECDYAEDLDLYLRIIEAGIISTKIDSVTVIYRQHGGNRSRDIARSRQALLDSLRASMRRRRAG
jgi:glycosyltransferase involved in cell wall biosynthesis